MKTNLSVGYTHIEGKGNFVYLNSDGFGISMSPDMARQTAMTLNAWASYVESLEDTEDTSEGASDGEENEGW